VGAAPSDEALEYQASVACTGAIAMARGGFAGLEGERTSAASMTTTLPPVVTAGAGAPHSMRAMAGVGVASTGDERLANALSTPAASWVSAREAAGGSLGASDSTTVPCPSSRMA